MDSSAQNAGLKVYSDKRTASMPKLSGLGPTGVIATKNIEDIIPSALIRVSSRSHQVGVGHARCHLVRAFRW